MGPARKDPVPRPSHGKGTASHPPTGSGSALRRPGRRPPGRLVRGLNTLQGQRGRPGNGVQGSLHHLGNL